jgi:hypothetical protein
MAIVLPIAKVLFSAKAMCHMLKENKVNSSEEKGRKI